MLNTPLFQGFGTISIKDFAEQLGKPTSTIYTWLRNGNIPKECFTKIGNVPISAKNTESCIKTELSP